MFSKCCVRFFSFFGSFIIQSHSIINDRCLVIAKRWAENNDFFSVAVVVVVGIVVVVAVFDIIIVRGGVAFRPNDTHTHTYSSNESKSHQSVTRIKGIELVTPIRRNTEGKSRQREEYLNEIHFWHETIIISKMINDCSLWVWVWVCGGYVCVSERTSVSLTILRQKTTTYIYIFGRLNRDSEMETAICVCTTKYVHKIDAISPFNWWRRHCMIVIGKMRTHTQLTSTTAKKIVTLNLSTCV